MTYDNQETVEIALSDLYSSTDTELFRDAAKSYLDAAFEFLCYREQDYEAFQDDHEELAKELALVAAKHNVSPSDLLDRMVNDFYFYLYVAALKGEGIEDDKSATPGSEYTLQALV